MKRSISLRNAKARAAGPRFLTVNCWGVAASNPGRIDSYGTKKRSEKMVRGTGFEPAQPFGHKRLTLTRLPVPPSPHWLDAAILPPNSIRKHRTLLTNDSTRFLYASSRPVFCVLRLQASSPRIFFSYLLLLSSPWVCAGTARLPSCQVCDILGIHGIVD